MFYMDREFSNWLQKKYIEWMAAEGEIRTQKDFADFLKIDKVTLSRYINAKRKNPDLKTVKKFADKLGPEVYDILGLARPDPQLQKLTSKWHALNQTTKDHILQIAEQGKDYQVE